MSHPDSQDLRAQLVAWAMTLSQAGKVVKENVLGEEDLAQLFQLFEEKEFVEFTEEESVVEAIQDLLEELGAPQAGVEQARQVFTTLQSVVKSERLVAEKIIDLKISNQEGYLSLANHGNVSIREVFNAPKTSEVISLQRQEHGLTPQIPETSQTSHIDLLSQAFEGLFDGLLDVAGDALSFLPGAKAGYANPQMSASPMLHAGQATLSGTDDLDDLSEVFNNLFDDSAQELAQSDSNSQSQASAAPSNLLASIQSFSKNLLKSISGQVSQYNDSQSENETTPVQEDSESVKEDAQSDADHQSQEDSGRSSLLDAIQTFSKSSLKKTTSVEVESKDKSVDPELKDTTVSVQEDTSSVNDEVQSDSTGQSHDDSGRSALLKAIQSNSHALKPTEVQPKQEPVKSPLLQAIEGFSKQALKEVDKSALERPAVTTTSEPSGVGKALLSAVNNLHVPLEDDSDEMDVQDLPSNREYAEQVLTADKLALAREKVENALSEKADELANRVAELVTEKLFDLAMHSPERVSSEVAQDEFNKIFKQVGGFLSTRLEGLEEILVLKLEQEIEDDLWDVTEVKDNHIETWEAAASDVIDNFIAQQQGLLTDYLSRIETPHCQLPFLVEAQETVQHDFYDVLHSNKPLEEAQESSQATGDDAQGQDSNFLVKALNHLRAAFIEHDDSSDEEFWSDEEDEFEDALSSDAELDQSELTDHGPEDPSAPSKLDSNRIEGFAKLFSGIGKQTDTSGQSSHADESDQGIDHKGQLDAARINDFAKLFSGVVKPSSQSSDLTQDDKATIKAQDVFSDVNDIQGLPQGQESVSDFSSAPEASVDPMNMPFQNFFDGLGDNLPPDM